ncbi:endonuclease [Candidatus Collierbacteria bacterium CG10_big_fil_rev_8_21_14_0_10_44_9]|uniref:Probable endonuclease 4 n=1 Tax=Candidatus Collierbacteria bacterium CG10_big_fil_rev_8_21_14_0_10_44_9 TaxID=1974535 RepID=A0A2H0VJ39_9BACT|nr:MAG: endonuclease [Candidatus Collierbacteria bacterium CG10_big_fil_rev_8_21_14_0_10_44_9]
MLFGYHVSTAGGLHKAFDEARKLDCTVIQIFVGSPQMWATPTVSDKEVEKFKTAQKNSAVKKVLVHSAYLPNPSSHKASLRNLSLKKLKDEAKIAYAIGADGYNFHCGSNQDSNQQGVAHVITTLNRLAELTDDKWPVKLILENDAGAGNRIGDTIEELGAIWKGLKNKKRFGFTLDTCHMFVSGIDLRTKKDISALLSKFDKLIGLAHLEFIHINDAKFGLGSKKDRHANIGEGEIGLDGFKYLLTSPKLKNLSFILETPRTGDLKLDLKDIRILKKMSNF